MSLISHHIINIITKIPHYVNANLEYFIQKDFLLVLFILTNTKIETKK